MRVGMIAGLALALAAPAVAAPLATGEYDNTLLVAYDPASRLVTGYFDMVQDGPPVRSCIFYLKGKLAGSSARVDTFYPADPKGDLIRGVLTVLGRGKVRVALPTDHGGCGNVWSFSDKTAPSDFELQTAVPWTSVRVVKSAKAHFYASPDAAAPQRAYLVSGDGVGVRQIQGAWAQADFTGGEHRISGWLNLSDLYPGP
jgi:hypothetical protein